MTVRHGLTLVVECDDRIGIVHAVSGFLAEHGCNIIDSQQFDDPRSRRFYLRIQADFPLDTSIQVLVDEFAPVAQAFDMTWQLVDSAIPMPTMIMVSHADHCLNEILDLWRSDRLPINITAIVSNHETLRPVAERFDLPFHHIPVTRETKPTAEQALVELINETETQLVVLARYMQILSDSLCSQLEGRAINIHHSFLPGFKGARPYHQAFERGVKQIGATAHYVTADLDEGPIIDQAVLRVDHRAGPDDLAFLGREAERAALAQAVRWHAERRIIVAGARTVIFP